MVCWRSCWRFRRGVHRAFLIGSIPFGYLIGRGVLPHRHPHPRLRQHRRDERAAHAREGRRRRGAAARRAQRLRSDAVYARGCSAGTWISTRCRRGKRSLPRSSPPARSRALLFSPWLRFRGGKGVATSFGAIFALTWPAGLVAVGGLARRCGDHALLVGRLDAGQRRWRLLRCGSSLARFRRRPTASSPRC